jgi:uncharacterized protein (DUF2336 family)
MHDNRNGFSRLTNLHTDLHANLHAQDKDAQMHNSLIAELEEAIKSGSHERRVNTLRSVTDLFLRDVDRFNEAQIEVFDDVLCHLIERIEAKALAELSARLAPIGNSPTGVIRQLARHDDIVVAEPVLTKSPRLTADDLIEIAQKKSLAHLLAISGRVHLDESVTDQLLSRADGEVAQKLALNTGARFSDTGFTALLKHAETDDSLAKRIGLRLDLPLSLLRELLLKATEAVRSWLLEHAPPSAKNEVQNIIATISNELIQESAAPRDFTQAQQLIRSIKERGVLNETMLLEFAKAQKYEEMVVALAELASAPIPKIAAVMRSERSGGLLVYCKAIGFKWPTVSTILKSRFAYHCISDHDLAQAKKDYFTLSQTSAQRTVRFWQVRETATMDDRPREHGIA